MKLYKYSTSFPYYYHSAGISFDEADGFEEKPKSYVRTAGYPRRVRKDMIGKPIPYEVTTGWELWLTERDDRKAAFIFSEAIRETRGHEEEKFRIRMNGFDAWLHTIEKIEEAGTCTSLEDQESQASADITITEEIL